MKIKKACWFAFFAFILAACLAVGSVFSVYEDNKNENRMRDFYLIPENTLDVVFVGSSSVHTCFYPDLAWEKYGFTSYCLGMDRCSYITVLPMVKEVIRTQNPKLIVIDIDEFTMPDEYMKNEHPIFYWLDASPWNKTKVETINKSIPLSSKAYYYFPFIRTHSVFSDLSSIKTTTGIIRRYLFRQNDAVYLKGSEISNIIEKDVEYLIDYSKVKSTKKISNCAEKYLNELLDFCKSSDTEILFIDYPKGRIQNEVNLYEKVYMIPTIQKIIENAGLKVYNYNTLNNPAELSVLDFFKPESHLNIYGCEKFTDYLSDYLVNNYNITTQHSEETISQWNSDAEYFDRIIEKLRNDKNDIVVNENTLSEYMQ